MVGKLDRRLERQKTVVTSLRQFVVLNYLSKSTECALSKEVVEIKVGGRKRAVCRHVGRANNGGLGGGFRSYILSSMSIQDK